MGIYLLFLKWMAAMVFKNSSIDPIFSITSFQFFLLQGPYLGIYLRFLKMMAAMVFKKQLKKLLIVC